MKLPKRKEIKENYACLRYSLIFETIVILCYYVHIRVICLDALKTQFLFRSWVINKNGFCEYDEARCFLILKI